ncbi:hypothetical protein Tco_0600269, partial [Tanacetum coccineum]
IQLPVVLERANIFQKNAIDPSKYTITLVHGLSLDVDDPVDVALAYREKMYINKSLTISHKYLKLGTSKIFASSKFSQKPSISSMDNSKRIDDSTKNYSLFEVNYDGMFDELPLRYAYGKVLPLKLSNSNRMTYSEILDMLVYKLECEIRALFYSIPRNSLETGLTIVECDNDVKKMYDTAELYGLINLYISHFPRNLASYYFKNLTFDEAHGD